MVVNVMSGYPGVSAKQNFNFFQEWVSENEDYFGGLGDGILELDDSGVESEPGLKNFEFLDKTEKTTETFELVRYC